MNRYEFRLFHEECLQGFVGVKGNVANFGAVAVGQGIVQFEDGAKHEARHISDGGEAFAEGNLVAIALPDGRAAIGVGHFLGSVNGVQPGQSGPEILGGFLQLGSHCLV